MHYESLLSISSKIRRREYSIPDVVEHQLERIRSVDPTLGSFSSVEAESALKRAEVLQKELLSGTWRGPLHGVPIAVKDIYGVEGQPFEIGMASRRGMVASTTATVVERLLAAGAIILGRLHTTEGVYAEHTTPFTAPKNPWDQERWVGVSSSGSGVATAAGLAFGTLASDTGGSIRMPSSANGVTGLKPTWGRVSRYGVFELAATLDHVGPITRSAVDAGIMLQTIAGHDPHDPTSSILPVDDYAVIGGTDLAGRRIGIDLDWAFTGISEATAVGLREALDIFQSLGAEIIPIRFPETDVIVDDWFKVCGVQTAQSHGDWYEKDRDMYGGALSEIIELGRGMSGMEYQQLLQRRAAFKGQAIASLRNLDAMLIPGLPFEPPLAKNMVSMDEKTVAEVHRYTVPFTMSQLPTLTMPSGFTPDGQLPISIQLVAGEFREKDLVALGAAYQSCTAWHTVHPSL